MSRFLMVKSIAPPVLHKNVFNIITWFWPANLFRLLQKGMCILNLMKIDLNLRPMYYRREIQYIGCSQIIPAPTRELRVYKCDLAHAFLVF